MYNLFKFIEDKRPEYRVPFELKLLHAPETLTKEELDVKDDLDLRGTLIQSLPNGLKVGGSLDLDNTPIQSLPNGLEVKDFLDLSNTPIQSLPDNLKVGDSLRLNNTSIQSLPNGLEVGGNLWLKNTPLAKEYTTEEQLKAKYPDLIVKKEIYL